MAAGGHTSMAPLMTSKLNAELDQKIIELDLKREGEPRPPAYSDEALALRFAELHADDLRYVAAWGRWLSWDGTRWQFDDTLSAYDLVRKTCRGAAAECNKPKLASVLASAKTVAAIERLARSDRRLAATVEQWDTDPWLLNTPGGVVDLQTGKLRRHRPGDYMTKITAVAPDAKCPTPTWIAFLDRITGHDVELADFMVVLSSPYRRAGLLHALHRDHFGQDSDDTLVVQGPSIAFNPTLDLRAIEAARAADPQGALAEWDGQFRSDIAQFLDDASIDAAIVHGRPLELPPRGGVRYFAYTDPSAGRHDAYTICVGHRDGDKIVADLVRGRKPPFDPAAVTKEYVVLARAYGCTTITSDNFAGEWHVSAVSGAGAVHARSELPASGLYLEGLPAFTRGLIEIPDSPQLVRELRLLERRVARSGKDSVGHGVGGSDDYANALFGMVYLAGAPTIDWAPVAMAFRGGHLAGGAGQPSPFQMMMGERARLQAQRRSQRGGRRW